MQGTTKHRRELEIVHNAPIQSCSPIQPRKSILRGYFGFVSATFYLLTPPQRSVALYRRPESILSNGRYLWIYHKALPSARSAILWYHLLQGKGRLWWTFCIFARQGPECSAISPRDCVCIAHSRFQQAMTYWVLELFVWLTGLQRSTKRSKNGKLAAMERG